jgi:glycosyltransferase involved in cell wall biosynthesis
MLHRLDSDPRGAGASDDRRQRPEVTVSMPAYNAGRFIRAAIESVLAQEGIALELVVVDDHSQDDTAAVVESITDGRLTLLRNGSRRGIGACHNRVLAHSRAPYVAHVDADDVLMPGALRKLVDALVADPGAGHAHCHFFDIDAHGRTTLDAFVRRWDLLRRRRSTTLDYRSALLTENVANALRTYRRSALDAVGGFDEGLPFGIDYDMTLRIVDRYRITLVPEFLYGRRLHAANTTERMRCKAVRFWAAMYLIRRRLIHSGRVSFIRAPRLDLAGFLRARARKIVARAGAAAGRAARRAAAIVRWRLCAPATAALYRWATERLAWWPLAWRTRRPDQSLPATRVVYYVRVFPVLSETFIQREVAALWELGVPCDAVAEQSGDSEHFGEAARRVAARTIYLPLRKADDWYALWRVASVRPLTAINVFLYLLLRSHGSVKSFRSDRIMWWRAIRLARLLRERGATHVHAAWAGSDALICLLAARLTGARYTVQARASDLHKHSQQSDLGERLGHAAFVITNARYNLAAIRAVLPPGRARDVHTIYEGVDLRDFAPCRGADDGAIPLILSVTRIVEPKGIEVLLGACRILKDQGIAFACEIVGGRAAAETSYYLAVRTLWRKLGLEAEVRFLGACSFERVREKYRHAALCVLAARPAPDGRRDVTPNTLIEAMAMGLPVVSTHSGAIAELVEDGVSGLLVPPCDEAALAAAIARLLADPDLRRAFGAAGRRRAEEHFDIRKNAVRYAALFGFQPARSADVASSYEPGLKISASSAGGVTSS